MGALSLSKKMFLNKVSFLLKKNQEGRREMSSWLPCCEWHNTTLATLQLHLLFGKHVGLADQLWRCPGHLQPALCFEWGTSQYFVLGAHIKHSLCAEWLHVAKALSGDCCYFFCLLEELGINILFSFCFFFFIFTCWFTMNLLKKFSLLYLFTF